MVEPHPQYGDRVHHVVRDGRTRRRLAHLRRRRRSQGASRHPLHVLELFSPYFSRLRRETAVVESPGNRGGHYEEALGLYIHGASRSQRGRVRGAFGGRRNARDSRFGHFDVA